MYIRHIQIERFRNLNNIELGPFTIPSAFSDLICIAGPNGAGKSSALEILTFGLTHRYSWQFFESRKIEAHVFSIQIGLTGDEISRVLLASPAERRDEYKTFITEHKGYWLFVNTKRRPSENFSDQTNEAIHGLVSREFANFQRKLGFFIRSDRFYGSKAYDTRQIFNFARRLTDQHVGTLSYRATSDQYTDMYEFLVEQSYHYTYALGLYQQSLDRGEPAQRPEDPLQPYNDLLGRLFPDHKFIQVTQKNLTLQVQLPNGLPINFSDLSSGEKEVFFILSFFIRHNVSNSIIIVDEPELHLHPELCRKLLRLMREIRPGNQIICATHSADLIDEAGRENTFFLRRLPNRQIICEPATSEHAVVRTLRDMFGYSGYVGITKKLVFIEGDSNSADRRTFINLFPDLSQEIKLIPVGSWDNTYRVNQVILSIIESNIGFFDSFCIRDRDFLSDAAIQAQVERGKGKLFILDRKEIENYLLDEELVSEILAHIYEIHLSSADVRKKLWQIARGMSGATLRDMTIAQFQDLYRSEDCSIGRHSQDQTIVDDNLGQMEGVITPLSDALIAKLIQVNRDIQERTVESAARTIFEQCKTRIISSLESEDWKAVFSGKAILTKFSTDQRIGAWPALQNLIIERLATAQERIPQSLTEIFRTISD